MQRDFDLESLVHDWIEEWSRKPVRIGWATDVLYDLARDEPESAWPIILALVERSPDTEVLGYVGEGPLEDLLNRHGPQFVDRVEEQALTNSRFKICLVSVSGWTRFAPRVFDIESFTHDWIEEWSSEPASWGWATDLLQYHIDHEPEAAWPLILRLVEHAPDDLRLSYVAAGPLETLLGLHGPQFIDRVEEEARRNSRFKECLIGAYPPSWPPDVHSRVNQAAGREAP